MGDTDLLDTASSRDIKSYEFSNHLGNVLNVVSDRKLGQDESSDGLAEYYLPKVLSRSDYYPFGLEMPERSYNISTYRFDFNGKPTDEELNEWQDYGMRMYSKRIGRFPSLDPLSKEYPYLTPYQFASNNPIAGIDLDGLEFANPQLIARQQMGETTQKVLTFTDVNDATVLVTWWTRRKETGAINVDGSKANGWDKTFAVLGSVVPYVGGSVIKQGVKQSLRSAEWTYNAITKGQRYADAIKGTKDGSLRKALISEGYDLTNKEAHHLIPTQLLKENNLVQNAVNAGFDFNGSINGIGLTKVSEGGVHAKHPNLTDQIREVLLKFERDNREYTQEEAKNFLEGFASQLKRQIKEESEGLGKKVNELVIPN